MKYKIEVISYDGKYSLMELSIWGQFSEWECYCFKKDCKKGREKKTTGVKISQITLFCYSNSCNQDEDKITFIIVTYIILPRCIKTTGLLMFNCYNNNYYLGLD